MPSYVSPGDRKRHFDNSRNFGQEKHDDYHASVLGTFGRKVIDIAVLFLAAYAFAFVPLGKRTGLQHLTAILHTEAARSAGRDVLGAADRLRKRLMGEDTQTPIRARGSPVVPKLPKRRAEAQTNVVVTDVSPSDGPDASM